MDLQLDSGGVKNMLRHSPHGSYLSKMTRRPHAVQGFLLTMLDSSSSKPNFAKKIWSLPSHLLRKRVAIPKFSPTRHVKSSNVFFTDIRDSLAPSQPGRACFVRQWRPTTRQTLQLELPLLLVCVAYSPKSLPKKWRYLPEQP